LWKKIFQWWLTLNLVGWTTVRFPAIVIERGLEPLNTRTDIRIRLNWWWKKKTKIEFWLKVHFLLPQYPTYPIDSEKATDVLLFLQVATLPVPPLLCRRRQLSKEKNWSQLFYFLFLCDKQVIKPIQQSRNGCPKHLHSIIISINGELL
jgi:hypothetical protein